LAVMWGELERNAYRLRCGRGLWWGVVADQCRGVALRCLGAWWPALGSSFLPPVLRVSAPCEARGSGALSDGAMPPLFAAVLGACALSSGGSVERVIRVLGKRPSDSKGSRLGAANPYLRTGYKNPWYH
jgi:hypothetical protein